MKNITNDFGQLYYAAAALVIYQRKGSGSDSYAEFFDMDDSGSPINGHPLTIKEGNRLAKALQTKDSKQESFLTPKGMLDASVLYVDSKRGKAVWYTKAQCRTLYFADKLEIPNGPAQIPPMVWVADRASVNVYALCSNKRPTKNTKLFYAPFFNVYEQGTVCMGTVDVSIKKTASLEEFIHSWESYFFNSYFTHLIEEHNPINGNCVLLWKSLVNNEAIFPTTVLKPTTKTIKDLLP